KIIMNLKKKPFVYLPSDKGGEFCVIEKARYTEAAVIHLQDTVIYRKIPPMKAETIEKKVNTTWRKIASNRNYTQGLKK
ncbi:hypothetical protein NL529_33755, partial [Klebsiella pneumoniae]|nr:hypothetical protein [Klebsiella pneumoniae]